LNALGAFFALTIGCSLSNLHAAIYVSSSLSSIKAWPDTAAMTSRPIEVSETAVLASVIMEGRRNHGSRLNRDW
jgi:hypothetical protein